MGFETSSLTDTDDAMSAKKQVKIQTRISVDSVRSF